MKISNNIQDCHHPKIEDPQLARYGKLSCIVYKGMNYNRDNDVNPENGKMSI